MAVEWKKIVCADLTLTAGTGLSGGGDLSESRTFNLDINGLAVQAIACCQGLS